MTIGQPGAVDRSQAGPPARLPAELRFILDFANPLRRPTVAPALDWEIVARGLDRQGLTRLVPEMIAAPGLVPEGEAAAMLRAVHRAKAAATLSQLRETLRICALLDKAGIRFLLVKGLALSVQLFGQPGIRSSQDIDLLVEPGSMGRVDAILKSLGYSRPAEDRARDEVAGPAVKEVGYLNREAGMLVEIHSRLTDNEDLFSPEFETLWDTRDTVTIGGRSLPTLGREHLATYLSVHGAKHNWARFMWLLDLVPLTGSPQAIDAVLAHARRFGLEAVLLHSLWLLHHWFGHAVPEAVLARARSSRMVRILNRMTILYHRNPRWFEAAPRRSWRRFYLNSVLGRVTSYSMKPGLGYWRGQLSLDLISPADRTIVALPKRFDWGYAALRPFGWLIRRLRR